MKPKVDLADPRVRAGIAFLDDRARATVGAVAEYLDAVRPVYAWSPGEAGGKTRPEQVGSCVLFTLGGEQFILSAAHVFEIHGQWPILVGWQERLVPLRGERYSTIQGPTGRHDSDVNDAAVFHVAREDVPSGMTAESLQLANLGSHGDSETRNFHALVGFRSKRSHFRDGVHVSHQETFATAEYPDGEYSKLGVDRVRSVAMAWEPLWLVDGRWNAAPVPRGMSGGALFEIPELPIRSEQGTGSTSLPLLSAILTECRQPRTGTPGALIGTRTGVHLGLIRKYCPSLAQLLD